MKTSVTRQGKQEAGTPAGARGGFSRSLLLGIMAAVLLGYLAFLFYLGRSRDSLPDSSVAEETGQKPFRTWKTVPTERPDTPPPRPEEATGPDEDVEKCSGWDLEPGSRLTYDFTQSRQVQFSMVVPQDMTQGMGQPQTFETQSVQVEVIQRGRLIVSVYDHEKEEEEEGPDGWLLKFRWSGPSVDSCIGEMPDAETQADMRREQQKLEAELAGSRLMAHLRADGRIESLKPSELTSADARNHWRDVLSRWQVVFPQEGYPLHWQHEEEDTTGIYMALYESQGSKPPRRLVKRKQDYLELREHGTPGGGRPVIDLGGEAQIDFERRPVTIRGWEDMSLQEPGAFSVTTHVHFAFTLISTEKDLHPGTLDRDVYAAWSGADVMAWSGEMIDAQEAYGEGDDRDPVEHARELIDLLRKLVALGGARSGQEVHIADGLIKAVRAGGAPAVEEVLNALTDDDLAGDDYTAILMGILGAAGSAEAQRGLMEVAGTDWPTPLKHMALESLTQVQAPTPETMATLKSLHRESEDVRDSALLLLGAMTDQLSQYDEERGREAADYIMTEAARIEQQLEHMPEDQRDQIEEDWITLLSAIGNMAPGEIPPIMETALADDTPRIREAAIRSLARIHGEEADRTLLEIMSDEEQGHARVLAVQAASLQQRGESVFEALCSLALEQEAPDLLRGSAVHAMRTWLDRAEAVETLRRVSRTDPSGDMRELAGQMLASLPEEESTLLD